MLDSKLQTKIDWYPHEKQQEILKSKARDVVICAGRRFGKSAVCAYVALKALLEADLKEVPCKIWIVAPSYELGGKVFDYLVRWFLRISPSQAKGVISRPLPQIKTAKGSIVQVKSAENPEGLLGEELDLVIVDECSRIKRRVWETYLYPTTTSRKGRTFFISTPFGKNWFYEQWIMAKNANAAFHFTSKDNPYFPEDEWERARIKLPADVFQQEFEAIFIESAGSVFRSIREVIDPDCLQPANSSHHYYAGLDLAKFRDFTVLTIVDKTDHKLVYFDRFHRLPYPLQKQRIITALRSYYNPYLTVDALNVGASVCDELRASGFDVHDFNTVGTISKDIDKTGSKMKLIEHLSTFIEDKNIYLPPIPALIDELESYSYQLSDSHNIKYGAPEGLNDDCVISLALAIWPLRGTARRQNIKAKRSMPARTIKKFQYF